MNKLLKFFRSFLIGSFFIVLLISLILVYFAIKELVLNYQLDFTYQGCILLYDNFKLCFAFVVALVPISTLIINFEQRGIAQINIDNQEIKLLHDTLLKKNECVKNKSIHEIIKLHGFLIIKDVYYLNTFHRIRNKKELSKVVNKFIASEIDKFEDYECKFKFSRKLFYVENEIKPHSYDSFNLIAKYLLLPAYEYQISFETDVKELYISIVVEISTKNAELITKGEMKNLVS